MLYMCIKPFSINSHRNHIKDDAINGSQNPKLILKLLKYQCEFHHRLAGILFGCCISIRISISITVYFITGLLKSVFGCCIAFSLSARHTVRKSGNMYLHSADVSQIYLHSADVSQIYLHQIYISQRYIWRSGFTIHISSEISEQYLCSRYNVNVRKKQKCKNTKKRKQVFFSSGRLSICALLCKDTKAI